MDQTRALTQIHYSAFHVDVRKQQVGGRGCIIARRANDGPSECCAFSLGRRLVVGWRRQETTMKDTMPEALFLDNPATQRTLLKPVARYRYIRS
jgi:hypothetical protein